LNHLIHSLPPLDRARDACGLALVAATRGGASRRIVELALAALANMEHRGAIGADGDTGDGAGILLSMPDAFLRRWAADAGIELPPPGRYGVATAFLPRAPAGRAACAAALETAAETAGLRVLGWRDVPVRADAAGAEARRSRPHVAQLVLGATTPDEDAFRRALAVARRRAHAAAPDVYVASASSRTLVYKGLLRAGRLADHYPDVADPALAASSAVVHSRFSTNTLGSWRLAHPFTHLAHNGEINTLRANVAAMVAREPTLASPRLGAALGALVPVLDPTASDSASLDAAFELLLLAGRSPAHAMAMLIPPAWEGHDGLGDDVRAFHEYHAALMEPWDGPAAVAYTDGAACGAALDRNGLRPARVAVARDGTVVVSSEAGAAPLPLSDLVEQSRLGPGGAISIEIGSGRIRRDGEVTAALARRQPYRRLVAATPLGRLPAAPSPRPPARALHALRLAFGYTEEDVAGPVAEMARRGAEPDASMGTDAALAVLSDRPQRLFAYFKQQFAQVTNPPIDPIRERAGMSLRTDIGPMGNPLDDAPQHLPRIVAPSPVLTGADLARLSGTVGSLRPTVLGTLFDAAAGAAGVEAALARLADEAAAAARRGPCVLVLSDRDVSAAAAPLPSLLALGAASARLVAEGTRPRASLIVDSGEPREVAHVALLVGYGAAAVCPWLALETARTLADDGDDPDAAERNVAAALGAGLLKTMSKMGIATVQGYRGAQLFEAVGLDRDLLDRHLPGTHCRVGGAGVARLAADALAAHAGAFAGPPEPALPVGGEHALRRDGAAHAWTPRSIVSLQRAVRLDERGAYDEYARALDEDGDAVTLRSLLVAGRAGPPVPLDAVEPATAIARRFSTGAMSLGSISPEAHETLAVAMNRLGARSNSGEGGEDLARSLPAPDGGLRRSAIKQVASGRFGVTAAYLADADELQIKIAQGAKPGEGGQLPGHKVDETIARLRHSSPGVTLISPPPHHDIYSIEDLAQLIADLRAANPRARVSVKLVSAAGVGTVAAGVAKAGADAIVVSGHDGGTGAAPLSSIRHAGLPWELGLAETQAALVANGLRGRVRLQVDGGLRTGRDVLVGALLGAEEFAFSTAPLIAAGCLMMRVCHLNTCPVGIATQDPELRRRFTGTPEHVIRFAMLVAEHVRRLMAGLGATSLDDLVGETALLAVDPAHPRRARADLSALLGPPSRAGFRRFAGAPRPSPAREADLVRLAEPALAGGAHVALERPITTADRSAGAAISGEIGRRHGAAGLRDGSVTIRFSGAAGQSFGAWGARGLTLVLEGVANDYVGKGLSGARLVLRPPADAGYPAHEATIAGNTALYGATSGEAFLRGRAGERFAVRNSGAEAVVEGAGDHLCEYMTGGAVVVLGPTGRNVAAGMTGGALYVHDPRGALPGRLAGGVHAEPLDRADAAVVRRLLARHLELTGSDEALRILLEGDAGLGAFARVASGRAAPAAAAPTAVPVRSAAGVGG
jgi:glutamate synthase domain-containing protein 2/glutamate synthase domain-containing protein 1/glutamate synthase domain-containing protein 3